jgi:hypothetical protein
MLQQSSVPSWIQRQSNFADLYGARRGKTLLRSIIHDTVYQRSLIAWDMRGAFVVSSRKAQLSRADGRPPHVRYASRTSSSSRARMWFLHTPRSRQGDFLCLLVRFVFSGHYNGDNCGTGENNTLHHSAL